MPPAPEVRAAGGLVVRDGDRGPEVALVHRPRYDDWSLPKGKLQDGEDWLAAALREVEEETGLRCEAGEELEPARYRDRKGRDKLVRWWSMRPLSGSFEVNDEVDELRWLIPETAVATLDYDHDRRLRLIEQTSSPSARRFSIAQGPTMGIVNTHGARGGPLLIRTWFVGTPRGGGPVACRGEHLRCQSRGARAPRLIYAAGRAGWDRSAPAP
jgi:8-oxo-dGTP diphosphatase